MLEDIESEIFNAIKADDIKSFETHVSKGAVLNISFGRFPILSLCYLYNAKKIIAKYEDRLLSISTYTRVEENLEMYTLFKQKAGRMLRIYAGKDNIIHPLEMLAILNQASRLESVYAKASKTNRQIENIQLIESIKQSKEVKATETKIVMPKQPLDKNLLKVAIAFMAVFLIVAIAFSGLAVYINYLGNGSEERPYRVVSYSQLKQAINDNAYIVLNKDIDVDEISFEEFSGVIDGNGHTITISNQQASMFKSMSGTIKNLNININANVESNVEFGLISSNLKGSINSVNIEINGSMKYTGSASSGMIYFSTLAITNEGSISNVILSGNIDVIGNGNSDVVYGAVANNKSTIEYITIDCNANLSEVNGANVSYLNQGSIENAVNNGKVIQTSNAYNCDLLVSSIAVENYGTIKNCQNNGELEIDAINESGVYSRIGGIACTNTKLIEHCKNTGKIICNAKYTVFVLGGISAIGDRYYQDELPTYKECASCGDVEISVEDSRSMGYIGGIVGGYDNYGYIDFVDNYSIMDVNTIGEYNLLLIGGMAGLWPSNGTLANNAYLFTTTVLHGIYVRRNYIIEVKYEAYDSGDGMFAGYTKKEDIEKLEIYW